MLPNAISICRKSLSIGILLLACFALPAIGQVQSTLTDVHHDVSRPLRDLASAAPADAAVAPREAEPARLIPVPPGVKPAGDPDPVLQRTSADAPTLLAPTPGLNFEGLGTGIPGFFIAGAPPDTNGAVGLTQYVQWVNLSFAIFDKTTGAITLKPVAGKSLWTGFGGNCETNNDGDPIVLYDKQADRWVFSQFAVRNPGGGLGPFLQCVAVSTTSDATGTYNRYAFQYSAFDDYPKMGVWPDAYYVTFNMFAPPSFSFAGADACAYDRNAMLAGQAATQICFQQGSSVGGLLPSDLDGRTAPPPGSPNYMIFFGANVLNLFKFHVDFATPANSTFTGPTVIPVAPFTPLCNGGRGCVPQPPTPAPPAAAALDSLADRLMYRLAYRNFGDHESLVVNHSVAVGTLASPAAGVRWYELQNPSGTPVVAQQSTFAPDTTGFRWMGSLAMDQAGDIALGYSLSSSTTFPTVALTARATGDPASTMGPETIIVSGTGSQTTDQFGNALTRWGDYSAMQVDPSDDCTFWYTTEYLKNTGAFNWNTRIASFKFPSCDKADLTITSAHTGNFTQGQAGATYTLTATNSGGLDTSGTVTVTDTLPTGLTATAIAGTGWTCDLPTLTCTRSDVLASKSSYPAITLTVNVANNAAGILSNSAAVSGGGELNTANDSATDSTTIIQLGPDPTIAITHTGAFIQGQTGTYSLAVSNVGLSPLDGTTVTVTDNLPTGLTANTVSGAGWSCSVGPPVQCTRADALASNASYPVIALTVKIAANAPAAVANTASVSGGGETNTLNDSSTDNVVVIPPPADLTIAKTHTGNFQQGQNFANYQITVTNSGPTATVGQVTMTETLPTGLTMVNMFGIGWTCSQTACTRSDALAAGASYPMISVSVNVASNAPASVTNTAVVSGGGEVNLANDTANDVTTITPTPDLAITKTHVGDFTVGLPGTYTIAVSNVGGGPTVGLVTMNDFLPNGMTATAITATGWTCSSVPTTFVNCTRSDALDSAASYPPIVVVVAVAGGFANEVNTANVNGGGELNFANDNASDPTVVNAPILAISKSHAPATFIVGQTGTYTISVSNTGATATSGSATNPVTVTDFLPQGMTATDLSASTGWTCSTVPTSFVTCTRSDVLGPASSYPAIVMAVRVDGAFSATVTNTASVSGGGDLNFHNASDPTPVTAPILGITKFHVGNFTVGQTGDYTITVNNTGTVATVGTVTMNDFLPFGMTATAINASGWTCPTVPTSFVNCSRSDALAAGGAYPSIIVTVSLDSSVGPNMTNFANVTGGGDLSFHGASDPTAVNVPDLSVAASHSGNFFVGQIGAAYTVNISNVGTTATAGGTINLTDQLFQGLTATAASGTGWSCSSSFPTTFVFCTRLAGTLAPGAAYPPITITLNVAPDAPASVLSLLNVGGIGDANFTNNFLNQFLPVSRVAVTSSGSNSATVAAGNAASFVFSANLATNPPVGTVTFSATGLPPNSNASFSPPSLTLSGPVALTINTSGNGHVAALRPTVPDRFGLGRLAVFFPFAGVIGFVLLRRTRRKSWLSPTLAISFLALTLGFIGCGGGGTPPPPPAPVVTPAGTYVITMTATSSNVTIPPVVTKVTLTVQ